MGVSVGVARKKRECAVFIVFGLCQPFSFLNVTLIFLQRTLLQGAHGFLADVGQAANDSMFWNPQKRVTTVIVPRVRSCCFSFQDQCSCTCSSLQSNSLQ